MQEVTPSGKPRARSLGIPFDGQPGPCNAITDVSGVAVGYTTLISGVGARVVGQGPVRTGVTAILPRGLAGAAVPVFAGCHTLNGAGELTGMHWVEESGQCEGPITLTNTHSCGVARDATIRWMVDNLAGRMPRWGLPVAGETYDGELNDINGFHVGVEHVVGAIDRAATGPLELGSVGGGTGMICYEFKGGSGSASRRLSIEGTAYTVGVFVQANFGLRAELVIAGVPVGRHIRGGELRSQAAGSIIAVAATDAPLLPQQLKRVARRLPLGVARSGAIGHNGSGDLFLAFSTANAQALGGDGALRRADFLANDALDALFAAAVEACDEAIIDSMVANESMAGCDDVEVRALPHDRVRELLRAHARLGDGSPA